MQNIICISYAKVLNTKFGMRTFAYRASKLWNDLPNELLDIKSLLKFKTSVKDFFN